MQQTVGDEFGEICVMGWQVRDGMHAAMPSRNVYWPPNTPGTLRLRLLALAPNKAGAPTLPFGVALESWARDAGGVFQHQFPRCIAMAPVGAWAAISIPLWGGGGAGDVARV